MAFRYALGVLFVLSLLLARGARGAAPDGKQEFQQAHQLVAAGDLLGAKRALVNAVKWDRDNQQYVQQYLLVQQAIKLQEAMKTQRDPQRWEAAAQSLSLFYSSQGFHAQALPVDEAIYQRLQTASAAVQLSETLLSLKQPDRVVEVLRGLGPGKATATSQAVLCVALAQQGDLNEAKRVASALAPAADADPYTLYWTARAQAAVGESARSLATLQRCYESVPPSRLDALKSHARLCSEFAGLAATAAFEQVLQTESKVSESKCSGGSSCSTCPMRGQCSSGK